MISEELARIVAIARKNEPDYHCSANYAVEELLPHRQQMLLLDEVIGVSSDLQALRAARKIAAYDAAFKGHFPGDPVYPGVLLIEIIAQAAACLIVINTQQSEPARAPKIRALRVLYADFTGPVVPGDELQVDVFILEPPTLVSTVTGRIRARGSICATAVVTIYVEP